MSDFAANIAQTVAANKPQFRAPGQSFPMTTKTETKGPGLLQQVMLPMLAELSGDVLADNFSPSAQRKKVDAVLKMYSSMEPAVREKLIQRPDVQTQFQKYAKDVPEAFMDAGEGRIAPIPIPRTKEQIEAGEIEKDPALLGLRESVDRTKAEIKTFAAGANLTDVQARIGEYNLTADRILDPIKRDKMKSEIKSIQADVDIKIEQAGVENARIGLTQSETKLRLAQTRAQSYETLFKKISDPSVLENLKADVEVKGANTELIKAQAGYYTDRLSYEGLKAINTSTTASSKALLSVRLAKQKELLEKSGGAMFLGTAGTQAYYKYVMDSLSATSGMFNSAPPNVKGDSGVMFWANFEMGECLKTFRKIEETSPDDPRLFEMQSEVENFLSNVRDAGTDKNPLITDDMARTAYYMALSLYSVKGPEGKRIPKPKPGGGFYLDQSQISLMENLLGQDNKYLLEQLSDKGKSYLIPWEGM